MLPHPTVVAVLLAVKVGKDVVSWLHRLGGPGLVLLGILDGSVIPMPGSLDALTIVLASGQKTMWPYYAGMSTVGAVIGAYLTYRLARKEGRDILEKRISKRRAQKVYGTFERWGFGAIAIPAITPPPLPMVPFVLAAGAMQYSRTKFLIAISLGRVARYTVLAFLASRYGPQILSAMSEYASTYGYPLLYSMIGIGVVVGLYFLIRYYRHKSAAQQT